MLHFPCALSLSELLIYERPFCIEGMMAERGVEAVYRAARITSRSAETPLARGRPPSPPKEAKHVQLVPQHSRLGTCHRFSSHLPAGQSSEQCCLVPKLPCCTAVH